MTKKLTRASRLEHLEQIIASGIVAVGEALMEIQQSELYLETHETFEKYAQERWGFNRSYSYQLIKNAKTLDNVSAIADTNTGKTLNNGQLREIGKLPDKQQAQVVAEVFSACEQEGRTPTAKDFAKAVKEKTKVDAVLEIPIEASVSEEVDASAFDDEYEDVPDDEPDTSFSDDEPQQPTQAPQATNERCCPCCGGTGVIRMDDDFPDVLAASDEFMDAWGSWQIYRIEKKKKLTPQTRRRQLSQFERWGVEKAIEAIETSITNGWTGVFDPEAKGKKVVQDINDQGF